MSVRQNKVQGCTKIGYRNRPILLHFNPIIFSTVVFKLKLRDLKLISSASMQLHNPGTGLWASNWYVLELSLRYRLGSAVNQSLGSMIFQPIIFKLSASVWEAFLWLTGYDFWIWIAYVGEALLYIITFILLKYTIRQCMQWERFEII